MNDTLGLNVITNGGSPRGKYTLLHSPKAGLLSRSKLPIIALIVGIGAGLFFSGAWNKVGLPTTPGCATVQSKHIRSSYTNTNVDVSANTFLRKSSEDESFPIAWLMSFPNSGTSYTSYLMRKVTGLHTATNYGTENIGEDGTSVAVFKESPGGPFWSDPLSNKYSFPESGSKGYLLTKTHCGGRCDQCPPKKYIESHHTFSRRCLEGYHIVKGEYGEPEEILDSYSKRIVGRAVHLIRDPFDNVVSRFHLTFKHFVKKNHTDRLDMYPRSKEGFRAFCKDLGERFYKEEKDSRFYRDVFDDVKNIPCYADFFRYIQWHNLAFTTTWDLKLPTIILHYENYTDNFNETKDVLLEFLDHDGINDPPLFVTGKTYRDYFTEDEIEAVSSMFSNLALDKTWDHTKHYFGQ